MKTNTKKIVFAVLIILVVILAALIHNRESASVQAPAAAPTPVATAMYACDGNKTITAAYYAGAASAPAKPDVPPTPGGSVALTFGGGSTMTLAQTISADGARYANADGSFVFWNKGNGAMVLENGQQKNYTGCISVKNDTGGLSEIYKNAADGFSLRYPSGYSVDESYQYQEMGPGKNIAGVKFTIPPSLASGTNLSSDSYVSVEMQPKAQECSADLFLDNAPKSTTVLDAGTTYSMTASTGAGAGNRYEETVYAIPGTNPCIAVRYFVHYGVIENYPPGAVKAFDQQALLAGFDAIRRTLVVNQ